MVLWFARRELAVVVGARLSAAEASGLAIVYATSVLSRVGALVVSLWVFFPQLRRPPAGLSDLMAAHGTGARLLTVAVVVVLAPIAEEVVFRGVLLPGLAQRLTPTSALLWSALIFALFHVPSHGAGAVAPGLLALVFGWARLRTGGLAAPIALHTTNNLLVTGASWLLA